MRPVQPSLRPLRRRWSSAWLLGPIGWAVLSAACRPPAKPAHAESALVVWTDRGPVAGKRVEGDVRAYLGIPFAAAPVGDRRWRPPVPPEAWSTPRDATRVGPACPQVNVPPYATTDEDCLTLNVWVPPGGAARKPVMVWIPGGAFIEGSGGYQLYEGARLAAREDVVVVTINYRIGALGFLSHPALAREAGLDANASFGLLDQQAALGWVQSNVAAFAGAPELVTIFGQSAGAWSVCAHLAMPASRGLFARALMESGACAGGLYFGPREAEAQGDAFARALGCSDLACLRAAPVERVLHALPSKHGYVVSPGVWWGPVVDGRSLPRVPLDSLRRGDSARVPLLLGWNRDEGLIHSTWPSGLSVEQRDGFVRDSFGEEAVAPTAARYAEVSVKDSFIDLMTDGQFACQDKRAARSFAAHDNPVFLYEYRHALESPKLHALGPTHSVEMWLVFGTEEAGIRLTDSERPLSHAIMDAWGRFARTGDPSGPDLAWPRYTPDDDTLLVLDAPSSLASHVKADACSFWDRFERTLR